MHLRRSCFARLRVFVQKLLLNTSFLSKKVQIFTIFPIELYDFSPRLCKIFLNLEP